MSEALRRRLHALIRDVPDFPKPGIVFKDITPLLADREGFAAATDLLTSHHAEGAIDVVVGIESRGFIFGAALARQLRCAFVPVRKPGKLPRPSHRAEYTLEYGSDAVEMHADALTAGQRVLVCDDLLATGGTAAASGELVRRGGAELMGYAFVIELGFLGGRERLGDAPVTSLLRYD